MADHARTHALICRKIAQLLKIAPASVRRFSATDANATLILAQALTPAAATIAKSAMQTYIDDIRDLA